MTYYISFFKLKNVIEMEIEKETLSLSDFDDPEFMTALSDKKTDLSGWTRSAKEEYLQEKVRRVLYQYGRNGLTSSEIANLAGISEPTARKYLEKLRSIRDSYYLKRRANLILYYPNGKPLHGFGHYRFIDGVNVIEAVLAEGPNENMYIHITEKRDTILEGEITEGGVMIPVSLIPKLKDSFDKLIEKAGI